MTETMRETSWQPKYAFSLRSLMFLTFVAALCAWLAHLSPILAAMMIPFIAAAYLRTIRAVQARSAAKPQFGKSPSLFKTFCTSIALLFALLFALMATAAFAGLAFALSLIAIAVRRSKPVRGYLWQWAGIAWKLVVDLLSYVHWLTVLFPLEELFNWCREHAVAGMSYLFGATRRLFRRCRYPDPSSAPSH